MKQTVSKIATGKVKGTSNRPRKGDFFNLKPANLVLSDGSVFEGLAPKWQQQDYRGEVVFNTGMTGYVESLTDPSYTGQILVFTYPLLGNYGVHKEAAWESDQVRPAGIVISELSFDWSHYDSHRSLLEWLADSGVPCLTGVDTRALTKWLRSHGTMAGVITRSQGTKPKGKLEQHFVSIKEPKVYNKGKGKRVILVDCGLKENILRSLLRWPVEVKRVPLDYDYTNEAYAGVLLSNGPGDPQAYDKTIDITKKALQSKRPLFGICLGSQLLALAAGATTYKLPFGHRGHNQPCHEVSGQRSYITSQNHGYAVDEATLPKGWEVTFRNLNDGSVEGIAHKQLPFFAVQFHPEASPGPTDTRWLFERFVATL